MTKTRFLNDLKSNLKEYPKSFVEETLDYYSEAIDDGMEDGLTEAESIERIGSLPVILESIRENALATSVPKVNKRFNTSSIILGVITFPVWFPLLITAFMVIWGIALAIIMVDLSFFIYGLVAVFSSFGLLFGKTPAAFGLHFGAGLISLGLAILFAFVVYYVGKWLVKLHIRFYRYIKAKLVGGGKANE